MRNEFILQSRSESFRAETILSDKLTRLRIALSTKFKDEDSKFTKKEFDAFVENLKESLDDPSIIEEELPNVTQALDKKEAPSEPDISRPELQLLWAAALLHIERKNKSSTPKPPYSPYSPYGYGGYYYSQVKFKNTELWRQINKSPIVRQVLASHELYLGEEINRKGVKFDWGEPGEEAHFDSNENVIKIDLFSALISGLEHTHSVMIREIGKSQLSTMFPEQNTKIREEILKLKAKESQLGKLNADDYKQMRRLALEWEMREMLWRTAEKCATQRYAERKGLENAQNYAYSLNHYLMTNSHFGSQALASFRDKGAEKMRNEEIQTLIKAKEELEKSLEELIEEGGEGVPLEFVKAIKEEMQALDEKLASLDTNTPVAKFLNILNAIELSFYKNNGLFSNDKESWERFGVRPDDVIRDHSKGAVPGFNANDNGGMIKGLSADFRYLLELCGGPNGIENIQAHASRKRTGKAYFNTLTDVYAFKRNALIEKVWDLYIEELAEEMMKELEEQLDEELGNEPPSQDQDGQEQDGQEGQGQEGEGQEGQGQEGQGQEGQGQEGQGQEGQGQEGQGQEGQGQEGQGQEGQGQEGSQNHDFGPEDKPFGSEDKSEPGKGEDFDPATAGTNDDSVDVENGQGQNQKMDDVDVPPEHPEGQEPGQDADGQGQDADGQGQEGADGKSLEEIQKELEEAMKKLQEEMEQQGQDGQGEDGQEADGQGEGQGQPQQGGDGDSDSPSDGAGDGGAEKTIEDLAVMDWQSYQSLMAHLKGYVNKAGRLLEKIREVQQEKITRRSRELEMLPEGKEMDRLDFESHQNLTIKKRTGQGLEKDDLNRFRKDERHNTPTTIDIVLLIDGSGSMTMDNYKVGKAKPMEIAILSSIILYEAAKSVDANVYIALWGNDDPIMLAKPGDDAKEVQKNLMKAKSGMNCGTNLAPSIQKITKVLSEHKSSSYSGYTHMMVISDGDISDADKAVNAVNTLLSQSDYTTLEFAILKKEGHAKSAMEEVADRVQTGNPTQKIGVHRDGDPNSIPAGIVGLIFEKIRRLQSFVAVPWAKKRKQFQAADRKFDMK